MFNFKRLAIDDIFLIEPSVFDDDRGFFYESFNKDNFEKGVGREVNFIQDNRSFSKHGVIRGLHFQNEPYAQGKLLSVIRGEILDVAVDIRKNSNTYGEYVAVNLSDSNKKQLWIPEGFAHGFQVLSDFAYIEYKVNNKYNKNSEVCLRWNDPFININWVDLDLKPIVSIKDSEGINFCDL